MVCHLHHDRSPASPPFLEPRFLLPDDGVAPLTSSSPPRMRAVMHLVHLVHWAPSTHPVDGPWEMFRSISLPGYRGSRLMQMRLCSARMPSANVIVLCRKPMTPNPGRHTPVTGSPGRRRPHGSPDSPAADAAPRAACGAGGRRPQRTPLASARARSGGPPSG